MGRMPFFGGSKAVADFLGMTQQDLTAALRSGKSLAQIASDHGKSRADLKAAIVSNTQTALSKAVTDGKMTQQRADEIVKNLQSNVDKIIDQTHTQKQERAPKQNGAPKQYAPKS